MTINKYDASSQVTKLVRVPVFPGSQVIRIVLFYCISRFSGDQNGSFSNISRFSGRQNYLFSTISKFSGAQKGLLSKS